MSTFSTYFPKPFLTFVLGMLAGGIATILSNHHCCMRLVQYWFND